MTKMMEKRKNQDLSYLNINWNGIMDYNFDKNNKQTSHNGNKYIK